MRERLKSVKTCFEETRPVLVLYLLFIFYLALAELMIYYQDLTRLLSTLEIMRGTLAIVVLIALPALGLYLIQVLLLIGAKRVMFGGVVDRIPRVLFAGNTLAVSGLWVSSLLILARKAVFARYLPEEMPLLIKLPFILIIICVPLLLTVKAFRSDRRSFTGSASKWCLVGLAGAFLFVVATGFLSRPVSAGFKGAEQAANRKYPHVVLILIDSAMADYFSLYGYGERTSPNIDRLAGDSYVFTRFYPVGFPTFPSVVSIYTSLYPTTHRKYTWFDAYGQRQKSIFDILGPMYDIHFLGLSPERLGFGENVRYRDKTGLSFLSFVDQKIFRDRTAMIRLKRITVLFERYYTRVRNEFEIVADSFEESGKVAGSLDEVLKERGQKPLFLHVHLTGVHPPLYRKESSPSVKPHVNRYLGKFDLPVPVLHDIEHAYCEDLKSADGLVGEIVEKLKKHGILDETVIVITSDHNLFLGLDKARSAPFRSFKEVPVRRIPLVIKVPHEKGGSIGHISDHTDIAPTLLDIMGIEIPRNMEGSSMRPLMAGGSFPAGHLNRKEKEHAFFSFSEGSGVGLDGVQIIDDHVYVYNPAKRAGRVFDANLNEVKGGAMVPRYEGIIKETLGGKR